MSKQVSEMFRQSREQTRTVDFNMYVGIKFYMDVKNYLIMSTTREDLEKQTGLGRIITERWEQVQKHKRTVRHDVRKNNKGQLMDAIIKLAYNYEEIPETLKEISTTVRNIYLNTPPTGWNKKTWLTMMNKPLKERLVIVGALIAAELDRRDFIEAAAKELADLRTCDAKHGKITGVISVKPKPKKNEPTRKVKKST